MTQKPRSLHFLDAFIDLALNSLPMNIEQVLGGKLDGWEIANNRLSATRPIKTKDGEVHSTMIVQYGDDGWQWVAALDTGELETPGEINEILAETQGALEVRDVPGKLPDPSKPQPGDVYESRDTRLVVASVNTFGDEEHVTYYASGRTTYCKLTEFAAMIASHWDMKPIKRLAVPMGCNPAHESAQQVEALKQQVETLKEKLAAANAKLARVQVAVAQ